MVEVEEHDEDAGDIPFPIENVPKKSSKQPTGKKRSRKQKETNDEDLVLKKAIIALETASSNPAKTDPTPGDIFGQFVASELKGIKHEYIRKVIKHKIQTVLFETQMQSISPFFHQGYLGINEKSSSAFETVNHGIMKTQHLSASQSNSPNTSLTAVRSTSTPISILPSSPSSSNTSEYSEACNSTESHYAVFQ